MTERTPDFDRVARVYRWAEYAALGPLLQRVRTHFISQLTGRQQALALGDGDGRFLAELLRSDDGLRAHAVDGSAVMLHLLHARCAFASLRLTTQHAALHDAEPPRSPDLLVSHFVFDCFPQPALDALIARTSHLSAPGAVWVVSDFGRPHSRLLRPFAAAYIRGLYLAFQALTGLPTHTLPGHARPLSLAGWTRTARREWLNGFLFTEIWSRGPYNQHTTGAAAAPSTLSMSSDATHPKPADALPNPEPAVPSLAEPDPGVFHHEPGKAPAEKETPGPA